MLPDPPALSNQTTFTGLIGERGLRIKNITKCHAVIEHSIYKVFCYHCANLLDFCVQNKLFTEIYAICISKTKC